MEKLLVTVIKSAIAKGMDIEIVECCDFRDGETFNISLKDDDTVLFESERMTLQGNPVDVDALKRVGYAIHSTTIR